MLQALWSASSGMLAQQMSMDNVSNNISNVNTPGYKGSRVEFQDLLYSQMRSPGRVTRSGQTLAAGIQIGHGSRPAATQLSFEQGPLEETGSPTDLALSGNAFFEVLLPDGSKAYTRDGSFKIDADGFLVSGNGEVVNMETPDNGLLTFTEGASKINFDDQGALFRNKSVLQLEQYSFTSPKDLQKVEPGIYMPTDNSGEAVLTPELIQQEIDNTEPPVDEEGNPLPIPEKPKPVVYYQVMLPSGDTAYTTQKNFKVDADGRLVTADQGYPLEPEMMADSITGEKAFAAGDVFTVDDNGSLNVPETAGKLNIMQFVNPAGLQKVGSNLYLPTANSGQAQPAQDYKVIRGSLEMSNVQVAEEMVNMITANRAYEMNSRAVRTADDMLGMANSMLRR